MPRTLFVQGYPDPDPARFAHARASAYANGARIAGHGVETVTIATLDLPPLRIRAEWEHGTALPETRSQIERHGYFVADARSHRAGGPVFNRITGLKDSRAK